MCPFTRGLERSTGTHGLPFWLETESILFPFRHLERRTVTCFQNTQSLASVDFAPPAYAKETGTTGSEQPPQEGRGGRGGGGGLLVRRMEQFQQL